jgi:peptidoglycan biosynthesis protein MviN/MurJ (putative lipid II flippase)
VGDRDGFARLLARTLIVVLTLGGISVAILYAYSQEIVAILFRRGAFGQDDVVALASLLRIMSPGVVAMLSVVILMRALFCLKQAERIAAVLGVSWPLLYFVLSGALHGRGVSGIAYSYSIAWIVIAAMIAGYVFHRIDQIGDRAQGDRVIS